MERVVRDKVSVLSREESLQSDENLIVFPVSGVLSIFYNGIRTHIENGSVLLLNKGLHNLEYNHCDLIVFSISSEELEYIIVNLSTNYDIDIYNDHICDCCKFHNYFVTKPSEIVAEFFASIQRLLSFEDFYEQNKRIKLAELIYLILSGEDACLRRRLLRFVGLCNNRFSQTVFGNVFNRVPITEMAQQSCLSLTAFKHEFSRRFHTSPHKWSSQQRLERAQTLLLTTNLSISEIATLCAYTNLSYFSKSFKQRYHATPTAYRKAHKVDW